MLWTLLVSFPLVGPSNAIDPVAANRFSEPIPITGPAAEPISRLLYPTPVLQDVDGDGRSEMILGDLFGHLWVCERVEGGKGVEWEAPRTLNQGGGGGLRFHNW